MISKHDNYNGGVALTTVIIIMALLISSGLTVVIAGIDHRRAASSQVANTKARINSRSCLEEAVQKIKFNPNFVGSLSLVAVDGGCEATISNDTNPTVKVVSYKGSYGESNYSTTAKVDFSTYPFSITE